MRRPRLCALIAFSTKTVDAGTNKRSYGLICPNLSDGIWPGSGQASGSRSCRGHGPPARCWAASPTHRPPAGQVSTRYNCLEPNQSMCFVLKLLPAFRPLPHKLMAKSVWLLLAHQQQEGKAGACNHFKTAFKPTLPKYSLACAGLTLASGVAATALPKADTAGANTASPAPAPPDRRASTQHIAPLSQRQQTSIQVCLQASERPAFCLTRYAATLRNLRQPTNAETWARAKATKRLPAVCSLYVANPFSSMPV